MKTLLIAADAMHLGFIGAYGSSWGVTPNIDALAVAGVVFDSHFAPRPTRLGAWGAIVRGSEKRPGGGEITRTNGEKLRPILHHVESPQATKKLVGLVKKSKQALHALLLPSLAPPWTIEPELFEAIVEPETEEGTEKVAAEPTVHGVEPLPDPPALLETEPDKRFFDRLFTSYAAVVAATDEIIGEILHWLEHASLLEDCHLVLTSASGLPLAEHRIITTGLPLLYEERIHLPLIIRYPNSDFAGARVGALTQPTDLHAAISEFLGQSSGSPDAQSLHSLVTEETERLHSFIHSQARLSHGTIQSFRSLDWHCLLTSGAEEDRVELYRKPEDRWEVNDVAQQEPEIVDLFNQRLKMPYLQTTGGD